MRFSKFTESQAEQVFKEVGSYVDYIMCTPIKVDFGEDIIDFTLYDRGRFEGCGKSILARLEKECVVNSKVFVPSVNNLDDSRKDCMQCTIL